jgi:nucleoid-associated protein YgaU
MGLFSFLKKSGSKTPKPAHEEIKAAESKGTSMSEFQKTIKLNFMRSTVHSSGIEIKDLTLDLDEDKLTVGGVANSNEDREKVILMLGNTEGIATVEDSIEVVEPAPESIFYEVKSGDSLSKIAKAHYGSANKYMVIFEANKPMLQDPDKIYPGQVLRIPPMD